MRRFLWVAGGLLLAGIWSLAGTGVSAQEGDAPTAETPAADGATPTDDQPGEGRRGRGRGPRGEGGEAGEGERPRRFPNPIFDALDTDGDGEISKKELSKAVASLKKLDKNGDGKLAVDEVTPSFGSFTPGGGNLGRPANPGEGGRRSGGGFGGPGAAGPGGGRPGAGGPGGFALPSSSDWVANLLKNDADGDGKLDEAELGAAFEAMMAQFRGGFGGRGGPGGPGAPGGTEGAPPAAEPATDDE